MSETRTPYDAKQEQMDLDHLALFVVSKLDGTGRLPTPSPRIDRLIAEGLIGLSTPHGLYLTEAGQKALKESDA